MKPYKKDDMETIDEFEERVRKVIVAYDVMRTQRDAAVGAMEALRARISTLEAALRPFATCSYGSIDGTSTLSVPRAAMIAARAALDSARREWESFTYIKAPTVTGTQEVSGLRYAQMYEVRPELTAPPAAEHPHPRCGAGHFMPPGKREGDECEDCLAVKRVAASTPPAEAAAGPDDAAAAHFEEQHHRTQMAECGMEPAAEPRLTVEMQVPLEIARLREQLRRREAEAVSYGKQIHELNRIAGDRERERDEARAERDADKRRLDWLQRRGVDLHWFGAGYSRMGWALGHPFDNKRHETVRDAIDAAIRAERKDGGE